MYAVDDIETKNMYHQMILLGAPACILGFAALLLSFKKLQFAQLIVPVEMIALTIMNLIINMSEIIEEKNDRFRQYNILIISASYLVFSLFLSSTWLIGFLSRLPAITLSYACGIAFRASAGDDIVIGQSIVLSTIIVFMMELAIYLSTKSQLMLFQKIKMVELQQQ